MGCVLYCVGTCKQIMVSSTDDGSHVSGAFVCEDCDKNGAVDKSHPYRAFAQTESQVKQNSIFYGGWIKRPVSDVLP